MVSFAAVESDESTCESGESERPRPLGCASLRFPAQARMEFEIQAKGFATREGLAPEVDARETTVVLEESGLPEIRGRVVARGRPVAGAHVDLVLADHDLVDNLIRRTSSGLDYANQSHCAVTDSDGRFVIPNEWPEYLWRVRAWSEGSAPGYSDTVRGAAPGLELELPEGGSLTGRVYLPRASVADVVLRLHRIPRPMFLNCQVGRDFRIRTDVNGEYRVDHLMPGAWLVAAELSPGQLVELGWREDEGEACRETPFVATVSADRTATRDLDLREPHGSCVLLGRLEVGDQIREGYAYLLSEGEQELRVAFSDVDSEGRFELRTRIAGRYRLVVNAGPGHHLKRLVTDLVSLSEGETFWERSLTLAEWSEDGVRLDPE
jgi:hypothetical protein